MSRAFLKLASVDPSPQWVRDERRVFACVDGGGPFMPHLLGFQRAQLEVALPWACSALGLPLR